MNSSFFSKISKSTGKFIDNRAEYASLLRSTLNEIPEIFQTSYNLENDNALINFLSKFIVILEDRYLQKIFEKNFRKNYIISVRFKKLVLANIVLLLVIQYLCDCKNI